MVTTTSRFRTALLAAGAAAVIPFLPFLLPPAYAQQSPVPKTVTSGKVLDWGVEHVRARGQQLIGAESWGEEIYMAMLPKEACRSDQSALEVFGVTEERSSDPDVSWRKSHTLGLEILNPGWNGYFAHQGEAATGARMEAPITDFVSTGKHPHAIELNVVSNPANRNQGGSGGLELTVNNLTGSDLSSCVPDDTTLCLLDGRFKATVDYTADGQEGQGKAIPLNDGSGTFWFFNEDNTELIVKVLDACDYNNRFWAGDAGITNVMATTRVEDTWSGAVWEKSEPGGPMHMSGLDVGAFATCDTTHLGLGRDYPQAQWSTTAGKIGLPERSTDATYLSARAKDDIAFLFTLGSSKAGDHTITTYQQFSCDAAAFEDYAICDSSAPSDRAYLAIAYNVLPDGKGEHGRGRAEQTLGYVIDLGVQPQIPITVVPEETFSDRQDTKGGLTPIDLQTGHRDFTYTVGNKPYHSQSTVAWGPDLVDAADCTSTEYEGRICPPVANWSFE